MPCSPHRFHDGRLGDQNWRAQSSEPENASSDPRTKGMMERVQEGLGKDLTELGEIFLRDSLAQVVNDESRAASCAPCGSCFAENLHR